MPSTEAGRHGNLRRQTFRRKAAAMSKPTKTEAELVAMARAELALHADS
jgi:hypothetical protein